MASVCSYVCSIQSIYTIYCQDIGLSTYQQEHNCTSKPLRAHNIENNFCECEVAVYVQYPIGMTYMHDVTVLL